MSHLTTMRKSARALLAAAAAAAALACDKPAVSPGLDIACKPADPTCQPGSISGSAVYSGTKRGDVVLLLFKTSLLPPPDGVGTSAASIAKINEADMFGGDASGVGPFSAPFAFSQVPPGAYQIRAFIDSTRQFQPFFDFAQQPHAGDPVGGHVEFDARGVPHLAAVAVGSGQALTQVTVALGQDLPFDPPSFVVTSAVNGKVTIPQTIDRPMLLHLSARNLGVPHAAFANAHFGMQLRLDAKGLPAISDGDGFYDVFPQVLLKQVDQVNEDGSRSPVAGAEAAIIPLKANALPVLPALFANPASVMGVDELDVAVLPIAGHLVPQPGASPSFEPIASIPAGSYQLVVIEGSGQIWTMPNSLASALPSQGVTFEVELQPQPSGGIRGFVRYQGEAKPGNIVVQAYKADPANPPPPLGTQLPVRVKIVRAGQVAKDASGFNVSYFLDGLTPGKYIVEALSDSDGNFAPFNLLQTPTRLDVVGAHLDSSGQIAQVTVAGGIVENVDVTLVGQPGLTPQGQGLALDPPAFEIDESLAPAQIAQDARGVIRFKLNARPVAFPIGAGTVDATRFTVALVTDAAGKTVDADGDGLPDVWPKILVVKLDDTDPRGLQQATPTVVLPAAVDPTPFLPRLLASPQPVLTTSVSVIVRPAAVDASNPAAPRRLEAMPAGRYKVVVMNQTGQVWQVPNEAGTDALDPRAAALSPASASQSKSFRVIPPASVPPAGSISGTLKVVLPQGATTFASAYVFAFDVRNPPPPRGTGTPLSADYHVAAEMAADGTIPYRLRALPPGSYYVTAVVDTRGDFALEPKLFAAAPGQGALVGGHADAGGALLPVAVAGDEVPNIAAVAGVPLPPRPSFVVLNPPGTQNAGQPATGQSDITTLFAGPPVLPDPNRPDMAARVTPARITLRAQTVLGPPTSPIAESTPAFFPVSFQRCDPTNTKAGVDGDFDNLPDLYPRVLIVKLSDNDLFGLTPDSQTTIIPAAIDPTTPTASGASLLVALGDCSSGTVVPTGELSVVLSPVAVRVGGDGSLTQIPIPSGRYGIVLESATGQTWRLPNELQGKLLDQSVATSTRAALDTQGAAITIVAPGVPDPTITGAIRGTARVTGFTASNVGNLIIAAYDAFNPPPPLGLGSPLAVQVVPRANLAALIQAGGTQFTYQLSNLANGAYVVAAIMDRANKLSPLLSFMATPPFQGQVAFVGGAVPQGVIVSGGAATGADFAIDAGTTRQLPFERPAYTVDTQTTPPVLSLAAGGAALKLVATTPAGLPYTPAAQGGAGFFHPTPAICGLSGKQVEDPTQTCTPGQPYTDATQSCSGNNHPFVSTQVYLKPIDTKSWLAPLARVDACQFCQAITGTVGCTAAPNAGNFTLDTFSVTITANAWVDTRTGAVTLGPQPAQNVTGHYAITVVEPTGQLWTIPNELRLANGVSGALQGVALTVTP